MRNDGHISNFEDLRHWFQLNQGGREPKPYFTVWSGYEPVQKKLILRNEEISDTEKSWELLQEILEMHTASGGGTFRVYLTSKPGNNIGVNTIFRIQGAAAVAGINGIGGAGNFGIYGSFKEALETELARERKMWELEREIEEIKAGNAAVSGIDQIREVFETVPALNALVHAFGMKMLGTPPVPQGGHQVAGVHATGEGIESDDPDGYDYETREPGLDKLRRVFPSVEMSLDRLLNWAIQNPEMARNLFGNINQPGA